MIDRFTGALAWCSRPFAAVFLAVFPIVVSAPAQACDGQVTVCAAAGDGGVVLIASGIPATVYLDGGADSALRRAAGDLAKDLGRVSGTDALLVSYSGLVSDDGGLAGHAVIVGVVGEGPLIDDLVARGLLDAGALAGEWEAFRQQVVDNPLPGVTRALVIAGSDRRGAVYGIYDLSERIGVSPWYWWADVPVERRGELYLTPGARDDRPGVRYRGFFINDEDPALGGWARKRFGGLNAEFYEHVFELLLRLKGNYLWPAMWGKSLAEDDPASLALAAEMGVVLGTSHHEPLTRAHVEWERARQAGRASGEWNYATNAEGLRRFWREGMDRFAASGADGVITIGMRGDGDEAMGEGTAVPLLERIVADQRAIIADVTGRPAEATPQVWALYKEVQDYHDQGMQVPDDVILLFADDNWGQIRRLPAAGAAPRKGGYGIYYHFDYVGGPRSYKWLNTVQTAKVWQQMDLAWQRGARDLWIVNVGDIKPMEAPLSFFMEQAWNPNAMTLEAAGQWPEDWAGRTFGDEHGEAIGRMIDAYARLAARRKPELIDAESFAIGGAGDGRLLRGESDELVLEWGALSNRVMDYAGRLDPALREAYFQLVAHPVLAMHNLYRLYNAVAWNRNLAALGDVRANHFADLAEQYFAFDAEIANIYHRQKGGKWDGMLNQPHIGYVSWNSPDADVMPQVERVPTDLSAELIAATVGMEWPRSAASPNVAIEMDRGTGFDNGRVRWAFMPGLGRTEGALFSQPQGLAATALEDGVRMEFAVTLEGGPVKAAIYLAPTLDSQAQGGLRIGVSLGDGPVQILTSTLEPTNDPGANRNQRDWEQAVKDNAQVLIADLGTVAAGRHTLKLWRIDDNVVVQRIAIGPDPTMGRYLGPPRQLVVMMEPAPPAP